MCPSSLVRELQGPDPPEVYAVKTDQGTFGFAQDVPTVLPGLLADLATYRKTAKREMVEAKGRGDAFAESLLNAKQLAYKVCMNSVYGFFGAAQGYLPCLPLAASVTATGRAMIERTRDLVCELCPGAEVVYGDTDSVMVRLPGPEDMRSQFEEGEKLAATISASFPPPIELEFEKVYMPYCLYGKKRYAGARCFFFRSRTPPPMRLDTDTLLLMYLAVVALDAVANFAVYRALVRGTVHGACALAGTAPYRCRDCAHRAVRSPLVWILAAAIVAAVAYRLLAPR